MIIEQMLMRSMKTQGDLKYGLRLLAKFVLTMIILVEVCNQMEDFCNVSLATTEQQVDSKSTELQKMLKILETYYHFFDRYDPYPVTENMMSIYSGIIGGDDVNGHNAYEERVQSLNHIIGNNFGDIKFQSKTEFYFSKQFSLQ